MEWRYQANWKVEDGLYEPKRKVNNRNSHNHPHIIGSFYSPKLERSVNYESLGERLFYYYLELDREVIRYYEQPVKVTVENEDGKKWSHVPDVLFFKHGSVPVLCQIKESEEEANKDAKLQLINRYCEEYAQLQGWLYEVIYPKKLPDVYTRNLRHLKRFLRQRKYYLEWEERIAQRLIYLESCQIRRLAEMFKDNIDPLALIPLINHLIAIGVFNVDFSEVINSNSVVMFNQGNYISPISF
ncbi:TnsA endonuclease N-terminal domain-containing protein [Paenibacillus sp. 19GGS1-52]|uniref:TnsA endonuclease N-terminal domain-containing protein n=1 Tax=Paenibacillus sp. 19GGS1-52 TaxID=2758563 RepID=UPI001EFB2FB0|nr:TnsA endonuclease N-terminal domain-containing protein [Paenibacillus sp. 19GGS1-52]ULO07050.1 TnsA endonuclease N-terminal domain-containing protein [Paenibacillus sp. 19GGS1-52]